MEPTLRTISSMPDLVTIKGISQGVLATLNEEGAWPEITRQLTELIDQQAAFFKGAHLVLDVKGRPISKDILIGLIDLLEERNVALAAVLSSEESTLQVARDLALLTDLADVQPPTRPNRPAPEPPPTEEDDTPAYDSEEYGTVGVLIKRTLRAGRTIRSRGHVVVIGDVNAGAEIIAVGDVIIWGKCRGTVHAGAQGDENAVVCALELTPTQLRIGGLITIPPQEGRHNPRPEMASVKDGRIEAAPWMT